MTKDISKCKPAADQLTLDELKRVNVSKVNLAAVQAAITLHEFEPSSGYAGFWKRLSAFVVDYVAFCVVCIFCGVMLFLFISPFFPSFWIGDGLNITSIAVASILSLLYWAGFESSPLQATPGKRLFGIIVTDLQGNRLAFCHAGLRWAGKLVTALTLGIGFLMVGFTKRKQALHDLLAGCLVINK